MIKELNGDDKSGEDAGRASDEVSDRQMLLKIVELASTDDLPDEALREMVEALEKIIETYKGKDN